MLLKNLGSLSHKFIVCSNLFPLTCGVSVLNVFIMRCVLVFFLSLIKYREQRLLEEESAYPVYNSKGGSVMWGGMVARICEVTSLNVGSRKRSRNQGKVINLKFCPRRHPSSDKAPLSKGSHALSSSIRHLGSRIPVDKLIGDSFHSDCHNIF